MQDHCCRNRPSNSVDCEVVRERGILCWGCSGKITTKLSRLFLFEDCIAKIIYSNPTRLMDHCHFKFFCFLFD